MAQAPILPLTIQTCNYENYASIVAIGDKQVNIHDPVRNAYWMLVLNRHDASIAANFHFSDNSQVPSQLNPYLGNSEYILVLTTRQLNSANIPVGAFYDYLIEEGAGIGLKTIEQIYGSLNCGTWATFGYTFVAIMGDPTTNGFEFYNYLNNAFVSTLLLVPFKVDDGVHYTPTTLTYSEG